ncbi:MAG: WD40/YVTN/BNR-like repeat-containing protein, partial [Terriglobales bacterium]
VIDPTDPRTVYVAALGHLWGPNAQRGLFKTTDGGATWHKVLFISDNTGVADVTLNPRSPNILVAAAYEHRRTPFGFNGGGPEGGLYRSVDGGATWTKLTQGLPAGADYGRIALAIYAKNPSVVYALVQTTARGRTGLYRSNDGGVSWQQVGSLNPRPSYFSQIRVDPDNDLRVWMLGTTVYYSQDGGKTFTTDRSPFVHPDFHGLWIDPGDSQHMILGSDGGVYVSRDAGRHWDYRNVMPLGQAYHVAFDNQQPYHVCAGFQDNGEWCGPSRTLSNRGIRNSDWRLTGGWDGMHVIPAPQNPNLIYSEWDDGNVWRRNMATNQTLTIKPAAPAGQLPYRFNWNTPLLLSSHDPNTLYMGAQFLLRSTNRGDSWTPISPDLTNNQNRNQMPILGALPTRNTLSLNDGISAWPTITAIAESPLSASVLWAGTDDGNLQVTQDGGKTWSNVAANAPGLPRGTYVSSIEASRTAPGTAYAAFDGHRDNDFHAYVYKTTDFGRTWTSIASNLPSSAGSVHVVRETPGYPNLLFLGAQFGGFYSLDDGASWQPLGFGLPHVQVDDIKIEPRTNDLIVATHGRSLYILDDINALEDLTPATKQAALSLFPIHSAVEWRVNGDAWFQGEHFAGPNPPVGAFVDFYVPSTPARATAARLTVSDGSGKLVRTINVADLHAGINRVVWDFRRTTAVPQPPKAVRPGYATACVLCGYGYAFDSTAHGIMVRPGTYTVTLAFNGAEQKQTVQVVPDPRLHVTAEVQAARQAAWLKLNALYQGASTDDGIAAATARSLAQALQVWKQPGAAAPDPAILAQADALAGQLNRLQQHLAARRAFGPSPALLPKISALMGQIETYATGFTASERAEVAALARQAAALHTRLQTLMTHGLAQLNATLLRARVPR